MSVKDIQSPEDILRYIEGCLNDFESGISTKTETAGYLLDLLTEMLERKNKWVKPEIVNL